MKKLMLLFAVIALCGLQVYAQRTVTGKVTNDAAEGLPGVTVVVKDADVTTMTDTDGSYSISLPDGSNTLIFNYPGLETQELAATGGTLNVTLKAADGTEIETVVVTALGVSREKKAIGYSATSMDGDDISKSKAVNPMDALKGKVAGMDVSTAPGPGATQNVIIRGASSFGNNQPLYIVDGVPIINAQNSAGSSLNSQVDFGSGINALNPDDIENLTVLKGAAATALYGSRAANGVIMITTKSGKNTEGKVRVSYDGSMTISMVGRLPDVQEEFGQGWSGDRALDENGNWGPAYDGKIRVWGNEVDFSQRAKPYSFMKNNIRSFFDHGMDFKNSISLSGGTGKTNYFLSLSQNSVNGPMPTDNDSYKRYTVSTRGSHKAGKLTVGTSVNFSTEKTKSVPSGQGSSLYQSLFEIANDISIKELADYKNNEFNNLDNYFTLYGLNPYFVLNELGASQNKNKLFGKVQLDYDILKRLKLTYRFGGDFETSRIETHSPVIEFSPGSPNETNSNGSPGSYRESRIRRSQMNHDLMATLNLDIGDDVDAIIIGGVNINQSKSDNLSGYISAVDIPLFYNLSNTTIPSESGQYSSMKRIMGVYMNADFSFRDFMYLTLTARNDWSSTLPQDKNSFFYPGVTFSFILTEMLQQQDIKTGIFDHVKFRVAYGMTGNDASVYYVYDRYVPGFSGNPGYPNIDNLSFPLNGVNAYMASDVLGNPDLKPEITSEFEAGIEVKMFGNRFGFDVSYYDRFTKGLIQVLPKDPSSGYTSRMENLGDVRNRGIEVEVNVTPVIYKDFSWNIGVNYAMNRNKVERLDVSEISLGGFGGAGIYAVEGKSLGQFKTARVRTALVDGKDCTVVDGEGIPLPTVEEEFLDKDINEKFRVGLTNTFSFKGFSLSGTLDFRYGGYIYSRTKDYMHWVGNSPESILNDRKPFLVPNSVIKLEDGTYTENTQAVAPQNLHKFYSRGGFDGSEYAVLDRSYLKLRNVSFSYQLPKEFCKRMEVTSVRLSLNAANILLWTPVENRYIDPETTTFGNDVSAKFGEFMANPGSQFYTFGVTLSF